MSRFTRSIGLSLSGIKSPPDVVATSFVLELFKIPKKVKTVLEGESPVNDAVSLTIFRFVIAAEIYVPFMIEKVANAFLIFTIMSIFIGLVIAQILYYDYKLFSTTTNILTALTLITPYIIYLIAKLFHYSDSLAVFRCCLVKIAGERYQTKLERSFSPGMGWHARRYFSGCYDYTT